MQNNTKCCKTKTLYITNYLLFTQTYKMRQNICYSPSLSARPRSKKVSRNRYLLFLYLWRKFTCRRRCGNKRCRLAAFCAVGLQGPLRRAEGMGVKRSRPRSAPLNAFPLCSPQGPLQAHGAKSGTPCLLFPIPLSASKLAPKV